MRRVLIVLQIALGTKVKATLGCTGAHDLGGLVGAPAGVTERVDVELDGLAIEAVEVQVVVRGAIRALLVALG